MLFRDKFQPSEWESLCAAPLNLTAILTDGAEEVPATSEVCRQIVLNELRQLTFYPPVVRVIFLSAAKLNPVSGENAETALSKLKETLKILRRSATAQETAEVQMSLAMMARVVMKWYGKTIAASLQATFPGKSMPLMAQVWEILEIGDSGTALSPDKFSAGDWQTLQSGLMRSWLYMSLLDGKIFPAESNIMRNLRRSSFPPLLWEMIPQTVANLDALYKAVSAESKSSLTTLSEIAAFAEEKLSAGDSVFYKMSLLILARDVAEANAPSQSNIVPALPENELAAISRLADALNLDKPSTINSVRPAQTEASEIEKIKENNLMTTTPENSGTVLPEETLPPVDEKIEKPANIAVQTTETVVPTNGDMPLTTDAPQILAEATNPAVPPISEIVPENTVSAADSVSPASAETINGDSSPAAPVSPTADTPAQALPPVKPLTIEFNLEEIEQELAGTLPDSLSSFGEYKRTVNIVAADLRDLMDTANELKMQNSAGLLGEMLRRVEENSFSIAVVGEFKRGKSTFINALLGKDILPSDILPCSATLNRVTYGIKPDVLIRYKDGREDHVEINQLQDYVTKLTEESEQKASQVKEAIVSYPLAYCQNNVEIIDTPGLNDDATMTDVTLGVLPQVDAAVLVIMAQSPFSEYERAFLEDKLLTSDLGRVIFLVTAIDRLNRPGDADRVVKAIKDRIRKYVIKRAAEQFGAESEEYEVYLKKIGEPRVFPVSAWQALQAKETADANLMAVSRFAEFENALEKFLSEERGAVFLQVPINRLLSAAGEVLSSFKIREGALRMQQSDFTAAHEKTLHEIENLRQRKNVEMQRLDAAARAVETEIKPLIAQLDETFKTTAGEVLDNAEITNDDVANQAAINKLVERLNAQIQTAVQSATQKQLEKIQLVVQRGVTAEAMRWTDFSDAMNVMSKNIEGRFGGDVLEMQDTTLTQGVGIVATLFGFGGAYTGYKVAGWKGAAAGGVASIGVGIGTLIAVGLVAGTFLALPVLILGTLAALPVGGWLTRKVFGDESVKKFRDQFKQTMLENLEKQLSAQSIETKIVAEVDKAFGELKNKIHLEVESSLDDTEKTLDELRAKRGRAEFMSEAELQQLTKLKRETVKIRKRAEKLNDLLSSVSNAPPPPTVSVVS